MDAGSPPEEYDMQTPVRWRFVRKTHAHGGRQSTGGIRHADPSAVATCT